MVVRVRITFASAWLNGFDRRLTSYINGWPAWLHPLMQAATYVGEPITVVASAVVAAFVAWKADNHALIKSLFLGVVAMGLESILKFFLHRTRPDTLYVTHMRFKSYSFPSGHAFGTTVIYGLFAYLAAKYLPSPWSILVPVLLGILILLVGISRIYLGAHYPTDVIGGWVLGGIVLFLIIHFIRP